MQNFSLLGPPGATRRRGWLALLWLLCCGTAAVAQPTSYCTANLGAYCGTGNANINLVAVGGTTLNNPNTTCNTVNGSGYTLYPTSGSTTGTLARGLTYQVGVMTPEAGIISVWFDWNQDGTFDASEWTQVALASTAGQTATVSVTVPATATLGLTGMRVRSRLSGNTNGAADACSNFGSGETEDYTVTIGPAPSCAPPTALTATNITTTGATLGFSGATNGTATNYIVQYGVSGFNPAQPSSGTNLYTTVNTTNTSLPVAGLTANTNYQFFVTKDCGGGQVSQTTAGFTFRTACVTPTYATLPVSESFENTWIGICDNQDAPSAFWRNTPPTGNNSWRRDDDGASAAWTSPTVGVYTPAGSQGTHSARFHSYYAGAGAIGTLDLYVNLSAAGNKVLQFDYLNTAGNDSLQVQVSTDGGNTFGAPLTRLGISGTVAQGWQPQNVSLTSTSATTVVRFRTKVTTTFTSDIGLDNVRINLLSGVPTCATNFSPAAGATNASRNTTLTWQAGTGVVTGYDVYFGTTATPPLVSTNQAGTSYTPAGGLLTANTTYYYQVIPRNANGPAVGCGVQSFTTNSVPVYCDPTTTNLGGVCGANNITSVTVGGSGLNATGLTCNTVTNTGATTTSAYTSYPVSGTTTGTLLRGLTYPVTLVNNGSSIQSVWVDFNQNGVFEASEWVQVSTTSTANAAITVNITVPPTAALGLTGLRVRSRGTGNPNGATDACTNMGGGETKDFTVTIGPAPACAPPTGLTATNVTTTSATLAFSAGSGTASNYIVQYGPSGFNPAQPNSGTNTYTTVNTTNLTVPVTGLTANTAYQFYVTKDCGGGQTSQTAGPYTFTTLCLAPVYATLPYLESFENTWVNGCDTHDIPNNSWRNTPVTGNNSWRREDDGASAAWTGPTSGAYTPTGSLGTHSARFHTYNASSGTIGTFDLFVNLSAAGAKRLSFDYINTSGTDSLVVQLSADGGTTFSRLAGYTVSGTAAAGFVTVVLPISSTSATAVLRFRAKSDFGVTDIGLDNIVLESATGCLTPANLSVTGTTATSAVVTWLTGGPGTYSVIYGPTGFNPSQPSSPTNTYTTVSGITAPPYTITGLTASTAYQFYVIQNCGAGSNSAMAGPASFQTACITPLYASLPFTESFENTWISRCGTNEVPNNNWRNTPITGNNSWRRDDDGASAAWTSPASGIYTPAASQGTHSARFHTYYATSGTVGTLDLFVNLSAAGAKRLSFDYINTTGTDSLVVQLSNDGGATFSNLSGYTVSSTFTTVVLPISSTSATAVLRFRAKSDFGLTDIGLDNIVLESATGCLTPAALTATTTTTTASLSWLTGGTGTYTVVYGPTGFNPSAPSSPTNSYTSVSGITAPPYNITGLTPGTTYQFYVTLNCTPTTNSGTAGPQSFTTQILNDDPCGATVLAVNNTCTPLSTTTFGATQTASTFYATAGQGAGCGSITAPHDVWFKFTTAATGPTSTAVRISVTGGAASVVRGYSGTACTGPLTYINCSGTASNTAAPNLDLVSLTPSTTYYVRVNEYSTTGILGNFTICASPVPNCPAPAGLAATNLTNTTATLTWSAPASTGSTFTVIYGPTGFSPTGGGTTVSGITTQSTTLTGLAPSTTYQFYVQQVCGGFNGSSTLTGPFSFTTPLTAPLNDEPCGAPALGNTALTSSNVGSTTSLQTGINTPSCAGGALPKDVWFTMTPSATTTTLTFTGAAAGAVRVFTSPNCSAGPFTEVFCQGASAANTGFTQPMTLTGLTAGQRYYVAVSGFGGSDTPGSFTVSGTNLLASKAQAETGALVVFPNPSNTGQLTLKLAGPFAGTGTATLLNALGQRVLERTLTGQAEQSLSTRGLATGLYTLRVTLGGQTFTRKVVLE